MDRLPSGGARVDSCRPIGLCVIGLIIARFAVFGVEIYIIAWVPVYRPSKRARNGARAVRLPGLVWIILAVGGSLAGLGAKAAVSGQEALALKSNLTPVGAERAGNAAGTISAWTGGYIASPPTYQKGPLARILLQGKNLYFPSPLRTSVNMQTSCLRVPSCYSKSTQLSHEYLSITPHRCGTRLGLCKYFPQCDVRARCT